MFRLYVSSTKFIVKNKVIYNIDAVKFEDDNDVDVNDFRFRPTFLLKVASILRSDVRVESFSFWRLRTLGVYYFYSYGMTIIDHGAIGNDLLFSARSTRSFFSFVALNGMMQRKKSADTFYGKMRTTFALLAGNAITIRLRVTFSRTFYPTVFSFFFHVFRFSNMQQIFKFPLTFSSG